MENLIGRLRAIGNRILEWWNRFTTRQKALIIAAVVFVVVVVIIIVVAVSRPQYVLLANCEDTTEASEVRDLLDGEGLTYTISDDGLTFKILKSQQSDANLLLGSSGIQAAGYSFDNVVDGGFSTTESDKQRKYVVYMEDYLARDILAKYSFVKNASVVLNIPENTGTLISSGAESYCTAVLELQGEFSTDSAAALARALATAIGNDTTDNIVLMDTDGNLLFSGDDDYSVSGSASSQLSVKSEAERLVTSEVKQVLLGTNEYDSIEVAANLVMDFSTVSSTDHTYTPADGQTQGVLSHEDVYSSENESGTGGVPGTTSNGEDGTTYVFEDDENSTSTVTEESRDYLPNESITSSETPPGTIDYSQSSVSVTAISYNVIKESDAKTQGLLDGVSWDEYKLANDGRERIAVDDDIFDVVAKATGFSTDNIAIVAYRENLFFDDVTSPVSATDVLQIVLIVVILALLAFVVLRSMRGVRHAEEEEELSVEDLLQSNQESQLENIELEEETEIRKLVGKFVEDNPEAAANLLRNWLNEDWG